jgi:hypothetical protein
VAKRIKHSTSSSTGLRNVCTFPAKTRSKVANITTRGELGVRGKGSISMQIEAPTKLVVLWQAGGVIFAWVLTVSGIFSGSLYVPFDNEFINVDTDEGRFGLAVFIYIMLSILFTVLTYLNYRKISRNNAK